MDSSTAPYKKVIFFIIDGCSTYYLEEQNLPGLETIVKNGVKSKYATPVFPTVSLTNYYSMFTGLDPEEHGMFSNEMYDTKRKEKFYVRMKENRDSWFAQAPETLWMTTGRVGIKTCLYWPWFVNFNTKLSLGENIHYGEDYDVFVKHHEEPEFETWIDHKMTEIVDRLKEPCDQYIVVYWGTLDNMAHMYGTRSGQAIAELKLVDSVVKNLQDKLELADLWSSVNLLVAADHGQLDAPIENRIMVERYVGDFSTSDDIEMTREREAFLLIYPVDGKEEQVYDRFIKAQIPHVSVLRNVDLPERYKVKNAENAPAIWLIADPGYSIVESSKPIEKYNIGVHGYDNTCEEMRGICMGRGPGFSCPSPALTEEPVSTIDYYHIMCKLLGITH